MTLAEKLDTLRAAGAKRIPTERRAILLSATDDLRASGIMDGVPKVGDSLPGFALRNARGSELHSADLLSRGAVVLTVFRGKW